MFVPHSEHSQKVDCEKSENILRKLSEQRPVKNRAVRFFGFLPLLLKKGDVTSTYRKLRPENRGFPGFRVLSVWFSWGFRGGTLYAVNVFPRSRGARFRGRRGHS